jgi:hypothetical protein
MFSTGANSLMAGHLNSFGAGTRVSATPASVNSGESTPAWVNRALLEFGLHQHGQWKFWQCDVVNRQGTAAGRERGKAGRSSRL